MILDIGKHYLYRYVREDTNTVFYVGIGTKHSDVFYTETQEYRRAFHTHNRSKHFKNIINKVPCYMEVLLESNDYEYIKSREVEFIDLYGLRSEGGTLCNLSKGGEGAKGLKRSDKERKGMSERMSGGNNPQSKEVINIVTKKVYPSLVDAAEDSVYTYLTLADKLSGKRVNNSDFIYVIDYKEGRRPVKFKNKTLTPVIDLVTGQIFKSAKECADHFGKHPSYICRILKRNIKPKKATINIKYYGVK